MPAPNSNAAGPTRALNPPPTVDDELLALTAEALAPKAQLLDDSQLGPPGDRLPEGQDVDTIVAAFAQRANSDWELAGHGREDALDFAAWLLGADASEQKREDLARKHFVIHRLARTIGWEDDRFAHAPTSGPGLQCVREGAAVLTFVHSGLGAVQLYSGSRTIGALVAVADGGTNEPVLAERALRGDVGRVRYEARMRSERYGLRWVGPQRRVAVLEHILRMGGRIAVALDTPGSVPATWFGREVQVSGGAAALACRTRRPVVPVIGRWRDGVADVYFGAPLHPAQDTQPVALTQRALDAAAEILGGDPSQLSGAFPARDLVRWRQMLRQQRARCVVLTARAKDARELVDAAKHELREARAHLEATSSARAEARKELEKLKVGRPAPQANHASDGAG